MMPGAAERVRATFQAAAGTVATSRFAATVSIGAASAALDAGRLCADRRAA